MTDADLARLDAAAAKIGDVARRTAMTMEQACAGITAAITPDVARAMLALLELSEYMRRTRLRTDLERRGIPPRLAAWLAPRWPRRWLPPASFD